MKDQILKDSQLERQSLSTYVEKAYLNYSMYVILDRALPHIGDGLKPVQRRIIYAMSELGLSNVAKFKKSARTIGDVLGKFHPHGDSACYEAMVLMAQNFSFRYPLVDGQGNWGSPDDPKSFAAMRYTESRLSAYASLLLDELKQGNTQWLPNFDGTLNEPSVLPARLPNILLNGTTGIAVGMATDIPPHNLEEVADACIHLLDNPKAQLDDICKIIKGPDFPTEAEIITPLADIKKIYESGRGSIKMRSVYHLDNGDVVITALPHQTSGARVLEQIVAQMNAKKLPLIADLRDESNHENPTRLVIVPKNNRVNIDVLMSHLFATTDLEKYFRININIIGIDGAPQVKPLLILLKEWLQWRHQYVRRRIEYRLEKILKRLHILEGLLVAFLNIDEVIGIIRTEDHPKPVLMDKFELSEIQADSILEIKLRQLAKLEEIKIRGEVNDLEKERDKLQLLLSSEKRINTLIKKEIIVDKKTFGDSRKSAIVSRNEAQAFLETDLVSSDPVTVILSKKGWIRCAKGHEVDPSTVNYKSGDAAHLSAKGKSNQQSVVIDSTGRVYSLLTHTLPSARGQGEPVTGRINPPSGATFQGLCIGDPEDCYLIASDAGYGFLTQHKDLISKNKAGKALITLPKNAHVIPPISMKNKEQKIVSITNQGRMLVFPVSELPKLTKGKGNKIISIPTANAAERTEYIHILALITEEEKITLYSGRKKLALNITHLQHYFGERGRRGNKLPRGLQSVDYIEITPDNKQ